MNCPKCGKNNCPKLTFNEISYRYCSKCGFKFDTNQEKITCPFCGSNRISPIFHSLRFVYCYECGRKFGKNNVSVKFVKDHKKFETMGKLPKATKSNMIDLFLDLFNFIKKEEIEND